MSARPQVLVLDDGELSDVLTVLGELGINCIRVPWDKYEPARHFPTRLLLMTNRYALLRLEAPDSGAAIREPEPARVVFTDHYSRKAQKRLSDCNIDYIVRHPAHPDALRLLLRRALDGGDERRGSIRTQLRAAIKIREGLLYRRATLADLSLTGCRLVTPFPLKEGSKIHVRLSPGLTMFRSLTLPGRIIRSKRRREPEIGEVISSGVHFDGLSTDAIDHLEALLAFFSTAPEMEDSTAKLPSIESLNEFYEPDASGGQRRTKRRATASNLEQQTPRATRCRYNQHVIAINEKARRVLIAKNLSVTGLCLEPTPHLTVGQGVEVAIPISGQKTPISLKAIVVRGSERTGVGLQFERNTPGAIEALESVVCSRLLTQARPS